MVNQILFRTILDSLSDSPTPMMLLLCDAGVALSAIGIALWLQPWRVVGRCGPPWAWLAACATMPALWCLDRLVDVPGMPIMSLTPLLVLMAGWPLAVLALVPVSIVAGLAAHLGLGDALHLLVWMGLVPATLMLGLGAASRRWLPKHIFVYILGRGFFGTLIATVLASAAALWMRPGSITADLGDQLVARLLMSFGEATVCGVLIASLVVFRPTVLATYADRLYLPR